MRPDLKPKFDNDNDRNLFKTTINNLYY